MGIDRGGPTASDDQRGGAYFRILGLVHTTVAAMAVLFSLSADGSVKALCSGHFYASVYQAGHLRFRESEERERYEGCAGVYLSQGYRAALRARRWLGWDCYY
ncbi:hypothetical protein GCM10022205_26770 [Spinactinospora alkalitolerans]